MIDLERLTDKKPAQATTGIETPAEPIPYTG
jgi:hypothetical protein